ncbi:acyl-CoA dehydrogenase family protein [Pelagibacterium halotolerans]|uniref:Acyl-CoA dehydrogenase n=1 Tax=Pelagibacterium halotolerans (strain DSM 22347 / JCM 15775 / CGMCC 1.7692 / B2) TaxID=1082931 RepID=G4RGT2_PELHB|nr:acyl-CoA dehydrogenase family protein [Pelagibacterium halotolerans]AEQ52121.1 acyl-CoA dehydrogenase [Pelagibacterium halotolerans B2]QJR18110.1 DNA alkylation response protein [Pelagibacterium halotolerans]SDZ83977.1 putative acyl-CoA dehydrogenase [Pelagibacterium halotolerans]
MSPADPFAITNQPPLRGALPLWNGDPVLRAVVPGNQTAPRHLAERLGRSETVSDGQRLATGPGPVLERFDTGGRRIDTVVYPEAYHRLMAIGLEAGYAALPWIESRPGGHTAHAAMVYLASQIEPGTCCPMTMTYAAIPVLRRHDGLAADLARLASVPAYDPADTPLAGKTSATIGMAMTEKQGGSDVRANRTIAEPADGAHRLTGHKWFCSAPMSDAFLTLAQGPEGLSCFLVPRRLPDGTLNAIHLMRLKAKLGNRANASAEIEYHGAHAELLGAPGDGVRTILEMVHHTRLDTAVAPAGLMRRALVEALYWARNRQTFGKTLIDQPLMASVLADLTLEWLGALRLAMRVATAFDDQETEFARLAVALAKYWNNKRCPLVTAEAMEALGGMGYIEDTPMPWLYREAPLNAIWEGSGNIIALDVMRTIARSPGALETLMSELNSARGTHAAFDAGIAGLEAMLAKSPDESQARRVTETMALLLQTSLLLRGPTPLAGEVFAATRLGGDWGHTFGTLPSGVDTRALIALAQS